VLKWTLYGDNFTYAQSRVLRKWTQNLHAGRVESPTCSKFFENRSRSSGARAKSPSRSRLRLEPTMSRLGHYQRLGLVSVSEIGLCVYGLVSLGLGLKCIVHIPGC